MESPGKKNYFRGKEKEFFIVLSTRLKALASFAFSPKTEKN